MTNGNNRGPAAGPIETRVLHGGYEPHGETGAMTFPLFASTAYAYGSAEEMEAVFAGRGPGYLYTRIQNPTVDAFERRMTAIEGGLASVACASGMAAIGAAVMTLAESGDEIVSANSLFGGTRSLFAFTLRRAGLVTRFVEACDPAAVRAAITPRTRLVFLETLGNPRLDVPDLAAVAEAAHAAGVPVLADNTAATPALCRPREWGADLVVHSASKYINGHGTAVGGVLTDSGTFDWSGARFPALKPFFERVRRLAFMAALRGRVHRDLGGCLSPFHAFLLLAGLESLAVRMDRHAANAARAAAALAADGRVEEVRYPGLESHPDRAVAHRQFGGRFGGLLTVRLGTQPRAFRFLNGLRLARIAANLGEARTLAIHPASTFCRDASDEERRAMGVTDDLVRFSIGLEHADDIVGDIFQALDHV